MAVPDPRFPEMRQLYAQGVSMVAIGDRFGVTRQRVHQILRAHEPGLVDEARGQRTSRAAGEARERLFREFARRAARALPCRVCGSWVLRRSGSLTCSARCAQLWSHARFRLDPGLRHRKALARARYAIRNADGTSPAMVRWARKYLARDELARTWEVPGSLASKAVASILAESGRTGPARTPATHASLGGGAGAG